MNRLSPPILCALGALLLLISTPALRAELGATDAAASSPAADAGFTLPVPRLFGEGQLLDAPSPEESGKARLVAFTGSARAAMRERLDFIAANRAESDCLGAAVAPGATARDNPLRLAFFVDSQLDIAAAGAALVLTPGFSIGATLEIPFTDFGYDFQSNRVTIGATFTF